MRKSIKPTETKRDNDPVAESEYDHPAFGQISVSRVSGHATLYDSDFQHQHYMVLRIGHSRLYRNLSRDWHNVTSQIIEVAMSESQWAQFITSPNQGDGTPCTLQMIAGQSIPGLPTVDRTTQFQSEAKITLDGAIQTLKSLQQTIQESNLPQRKKEEYSRKLESAYMQITNSLDFVLKQFGEHMEETVERAKSEVNAYVGQAVQRAGLDKLATSVLSLESKK